MKNTIFSLALCAFFGLSAAMAAPQDQSAAPQATQAEGRHRADPSRQVQFLTKKLNLTPDQQAKLLPILSDRQQQMQAVFSDTSLSAKERHEKMRAIREDNEAKVKALLTDDQKQSYEQLRQQMHDRQQQRHE